MDQVHVIRYKVLQEGKSIRGVAREMGFSRNTIRKYLEVSEPLRRESGPRRRPKLEKVAPRMDELLQEWGQRSTRKQRITGTRLHRQLVEEGYEVGITTVRSYLWEKRRQTSEVLIPLVWRAGDAAQVDFFEVTVELKGQCQVVWKFLLRLMHSEKDFVWLYPWQDQVSFLDGHVRAFEWLGAVPRRIIYDNLSSAVKRRVGLQRELTERFQALSSHYLFEPCFTRPGEGHDKGGVEGRGKGIRLQHLTPIPRGESLEEIRLALLADVERAAAARGIPERFARERCQLRELPAVAFEPRRLERVRVNRQAMVRVEGAEYTVDSRWRHLEVEAWVGAEDIRFCCRGESLMVVRQPRKGRRVQYRHYLPELAKKPQAVRQVAPELVAELGVPYGQLWQALAETLGELKGARVLAGVLAAIVRLGEEPVREAVHSALEAGRCDLLTLHRRLYPRQVRQVSVPAALQGYSIETATAGDFDHLLQGGGA